MCVCVFVCVCVCVCVCVWWGRGNKLGGSKAVVARGVGVYVVGGAG